MRSRDWSSDVCSSDLEDAGEVVHGSPEAGPVGRLVAEHGEELGGEGVVDDVELHGGAVIGRRRGHPGMMAAMDRPTLAAMIDHTLLRPEATAEEVVRSEERRGGKESVSRCRSRWLAYEYRKTKSTTK